MNGKKKIKIFLIIGITTVLLPVFFVFLNSKNRSSLRTPEPVVQTSAPKTIEKPVVRFLAVGDIMLGRFVETLMLGKGDQYPFEHIVDFLKSWDTVFANLEGPIFDSGPQTPLDSVRFSFRASAAPLLKANNVGIVSLANNHMSDYGPEGFAETKTRLQKEQIVSFGHAIHISSEDSVTMTQINGQKIVLIGFNATFTQVFDPKQAVQIVKATRAKEKGFLMVSMHWGTEYTLHSNTTQEELAHTLIDAGADVIISQHPHVTQEIEKYKGKLIFYSLGNFIFDQYFSTDVQQGLAVGVELNDSSAAFTLFPIQSTRSQPALMGAETRQTFLNALARRSDAMLADEIKQGIIHSKN